ILIGTGSETPICVQAYEQLTSEGIKVRVVSMPSWELFEKQDEVYRHEVLPPRVRARVAVEKAAAFGWERYVGLDGQIVALRTFGASAPLAELQKKFGFTADNVAAAARAQVKKARETFL
ncbi:MAG TPA: transketolase C-terminal domain-containing protein, partial [Burkholderiales bacterium]|nr:transketolase C-terminal domain-containing protein [Burkholderiales bacterium]